MGQYADLLDPSPDDARARLNLGAAAGVNADEAARNQALARRYGLPPEAVKTFRPEYTASAAAEDAQPLLQQAPRLRGWLADPVRGQDRANVSHDDLSQLAAIERDTSLLGNIGRASWASLHQAGGALYGLAAGPFGLLGLSGVESKLLAFGQSAMETAALVGPDLRHAGAAERGFYSGIGSLTQNLIAAPLALMPGGQAAALTFLSAPAAGASYMKGREHDLSPIAAATYGASDAAIEYGTERLGLGPLLKGLKANDPFLKLLFGTLAREGFGEQVATAAQDLNAWAALNEGQTFGDYLAARPEAALETLVATAIGTGGQVTLMRGMQSAANRIARRDRSAEEETDSQQLLTHLAALAQESKLRQRDPEAFAELADQITDDSVPTLYADAKALLQSGVTPAQLAAVSPTAAAQLEQAAATGGDVAIPAPEFLTSAPGSPILPALMQHLRTDPEAMSPSEAQAWLSSERGVQLQEQIEQATQRAMTDDAARTEVEAVKAEVLGMLQSAGRTGPAADSMAALISAHTATLAADLGITVQEAWQRYGLGGVVTELGGGQALEQQDGGSALQQVRGGDTPTAQADDAPYETDLFGEPLPRPAGRGRGRKRAAATERDVDAAGSVRPGVEFPPGEYATRTQLVDTRQQQLGTSGAVVSLHDAANALAYLNRSAVERFDALVTDDSGQPLAVIGGFKGALSQASVYPATIVGEAMQIPGARDLWFVHNHPSGSPSLSQGDRHLEDTLADVLSGTGLRSRGIIAVTDRQWEGRNRQSGGDESGMVQPSAGDTVPAQEREIASSGKLHPAITSPAHAKDAVQTLSGGRSGIVLTDAQHQPTAFVPWAPDAALPMKWTGHLDALFRAVSLANAGAAIIAQGGMTIEQAQNLGAALAKVDVRVLDIIPQVGPTAAESGQPTAANVLRQQAQGAYFPEQRVIALLNAKNLTTFLHEAGHYFFDQRLRIASALVAQQRQGASLSAGEQRIVNDMTALLRWHGFKGDAPEMFREWYSLDFEQQREHHERTAESFERYLFTGKAPSLELQTAFQRFAAWLKSWYRNLKDFLDAHPEAGKLNDEVRAVFDRMLATDAAIEEMQALRGMEPALTPEQAAALGVDLSEYNALGAQATEAAQAQLQTRGLRDMKWLGNARAKELRRLQKQAAQLRADVKREARAEVMREPVYRAWALLTGRDGAAPPAQESEAVEAWRDATSAWNDRRAQVKADAVAAERARLWDQSPEAAADYPSAQARGMAKGQFLARHKRVTEASAEATAAQWEQENPKPKRPDSEAPEDDGLGALGSARLDTSALREAYGSGQDAIWRKLSALRMTSDTRGSDPDAVAALFTHADGTPAFESGDAMIRALAEAEPPGQVIEALTDQKMLQQHGELATPEALEQAADLAVHNEARARMVATELQALERATTVRGDAGTDAHGRRRTYDALAAAARQFAQGLVGRTRVRDLKPSRFTAAEAKHAREAVRALRAGDTAAAAEAKRTQLVQHHTAREALQAAEEVDRIVRYLRRMGSRPASVHHSYNDQIEALLERFDLRAATDRAVDRRVSLRDWLAEQAEEGIEPDIDPAIANEALRTSWRELTVDELRALRDAVQQIEHVGRLKTKLLTAKDLREFGAARDALVGSIDANRRGRVNTDDETASSVMGRARQGLKRFGYGHLKAAMLARTMDGGQDGGTAWELLIRPANDAADRETSMTAQASRDLAAILNPVLKGRDRSITFPGLPRLNGAVRSLNREQRLAVALNWGNEGNRQRLTSGYGWTPAQVQAVLQSLTAAEWHAVQAAWDRIEVYRPQIAALERRMTGKEPNWVEPAEVVVRTADGVDLTLRGGYYPVKYDPRASDRAEQQEKAELADVARRAAFTSTTTRRSFTKARAGEVHDRKLMLTLDGLFGGVSEVIHDLAWRETLFDINRLLRDKAVSATVRGAYGVDVLNQFRDWTSAIATDGRRVADTLDAASAWVRQGVSVAGLGFNIMSALVQPLGLTQSIVRVGGRWVGTGVKQYLAHPVRTTHEVSAKSAFMAERSRTRFRELNEVRNRVRGQSATRAAFDGAAYLMMLRMQQAVDVPTWLGAYEKAIASGKADEARAVALADQAVRDAQGSGLLSDQSAVERGGPLHKLFTVFYSFFNTTLNLAVANGMTVEGYARQAVNYAMLFVVPTVLGFALKEALKPGGEDEDWEDTAAKLVGEQLSFVLGTVVGLREFTGAFQAATNTSNFPADYRGPTGLRLVTDTVKLGQQIGQGEADAALLRATVSVAGDLFRLPAGQVNKTIQGAQAVADGETDGPVEAARALVFGFDRH
jgi:hypothetical protein